MSKIIEETGWNELSHVVETEEGKQYLVSSVETPGNKYETLVLDWEDDELVDWYGAYRKIYPDYESMRTGHSDICERLEEILERGVYFDEG